jgi:hypothetical protein
MNRIRSQLTYANVAATLALFLVLSGGTAVALTGTNTVFTDDIVNDQVKSADVRNDDLGEGGLAALDLRAGSVRGSEVLDNSLSGADVNESSFGIVPDAAHATNSDQLGGRAATGYQRRVAGDCSGGGAIQSIRGDGGVSCADQAVFPISADLTSESGNNSAVVSFSPSVLTLFAVCESGGANVAFTNNGTGGATLNWIFSQGGATSTVNASGTSVDGAFGLNPRVIFAFGNRVEGQWIFANAAGITTVNLHGFIAPGSPAFCEFKGTAVFAPNT